MLIYICKLYEQTIINRVPSLTKQLLKLGNYCRFPGRTNLLVLTLHLPNEYTDLNITVTRCGRVYVDV